MSRRKWDLAQRRTPEHGERKYTRWVYSLDGGKTWQGPLVFGNPVGEEFCVSVVTKIRQGSSHSDRLKCKPEIGGENEYPAVDF